VQQNFWLDPRVARGVNFRWHQRQHVSESGFCVGSSAVRTRPALEFAVIAVAGIGEFGNCLTNSKASNMQPIYSYKVTDATAATRAPLGWSKWTMWQYTQSGCVSGVDVRCDRSRFAGSLEELIAWWGRQPNSSPAES
jgi:hypothetical protein